MDSKETGLLRQTEQRGREATVAMQPFSSQEGQQEHQDQEGEVHFACVATGLRHREVSMACTK